MKDELYLNSEDGIFEGWQPLFQLFAFHDQLQSFQQAFPCQTGIAAKTLSLGVFARTFFTAATL